MNLMNNKAELRRFCAQVRKNLPCGAKQKKRILNEVSDSGINWIKQNPGKPFSEFQRDFGGPAVIAAAYLEQMDTSELLRKVSVHKKVLWISLSLAIIILLVCIGTALWAMNDIHEYSAGRVIVYPAVDEGM